MSFDVLIIRQIPPIQKGEISSSFCNSSGLPPFPTWGRMPQSPSLGVELAARCTGSEGTPGLQRLGAARLLKAYLSEISLPSGSPISGAHQSRNACVTPLPAALMYSSGIFFSTSITSFTSMSVVRTR